ncbi:MAG: 4-hydroxy-tetrahydrodipicolinate synthase [Candidatus Heimdallarchaeota archaeon]|nr:4-hydroxy-tetrahydrodipicolinate synthase [Candidatus Heimdallarchaeota archaeon]
MFEGIYVATITPFTSEGKIDYEIYREHLEFLMDHEVHGIVVCGTTGEGAVLSIDEHRRMIEKSVEVSGELGFKIVAGTRTNDTARTIELTKQAKEAGADGALIVTPYYNKPTQEGLYQHYKAIANAVDIKIILYNVPSRTSVNLNSHTVKRLAEIENIVGIKEASGNLDQVTEIARSTNLEILSGDDALSLSMYALGGVGVVSVVGNIVPGDILEIYNAWQAGEFQKALKISNKLYPLSKAMFVETNPVPVKTMLMLLGRYNGSVRLPLVPIKPENKEILNQILISFGMAGDSEI